MFIRYYFCSCVAEMPYCPYCAKEVSPQAIACPNCGHPLQQAQPVPSTPQPTPQPSKSHAGRNFAVVMIILIILFFFVPFIPASAVSGNFGFSSQASGFVSPSALVLHCGMVFVQGSSSFLGYAYSSGSYNGFFCP